MPKVLDELSRLQKELPELDPHERLILKMCLNLLESHYEVRNPQNRLTDEEYLAVPGRWEFQNGMLRDY